jgi:hypothetical protein
VIRWGNPETVKAKRDLRQLNNQDILDLKKMMFGPVPG